MQANHSNTDMSTSLSLGNESGCNSTTSVEAESCSGVSDTSAKEITRGSAYKNTASGESSLKVSEESPDSEESVNDSLPSEETRHLNLNVILSSDAVQSNHVSSSSHLPKMSVVSTVCQADDVWCSRPKTLELILLASRWAEEE